MQSDVMMDNVSDCGGRKGYIFNEARPEVRRSVRRLL